MSLIAGPASVALVQYVGGSIHVVEGKSRLDLITKVLDTAPPEIVAGYGSEPHLQFIGDVRRLAREAELRAVDFNAELEKEHTNGD